MKELSRMLVKKKDWKEIETEKKFWGEASETETLRKKALKKNFGEFSVYG